MTKRTEWDYLEEAFTLTVFLEIKVNYNNVHKFHSYFSPTFDFSFNHRTTALSPIDYVSYNLLANSGTVIHINITCSLFSLMLNQFQHFPTRLHFLPTFGVLLPLGNYLDTCIMGLFISFSIMVLTKCLVNMPLVKD